MQGVRFVLQDAAAKESSRRRVLAIFEQETLTCIEGHCSESLGTLRSITDLQAVCGVQYSKRSLNDKAKRGSANDALHFAADGKNCP